MTDDPSVASHPLAAGFADCRRVSVSYTEQPAGELHETQMARLFAAATDHLRVIYELTALTASTIEKPSLEMAWAR